MNPRFKAVNIDCNFDYTFETAKLAAAGIELVAKKSVTEDEIIRACQDAEAVILEGAMTPMTAKVISSLPKCRMSWPVSANSPSKPDRTWVIL